MKPILTAINAIPVSRAQDSSHPGYAEQNRDMFAACYDALAGDATIVLFPEGQSHSESELQPLKTGAARIALGAARQHSELGVRFVPVGLKFGTRERFRSRVLLTIGEPIDPLDGVSDPDPEDRESLQAVTERLADESPVRKQLSDAYLALKNVQPRRVARIVEAVNAYDRLLKVLSIRHECRGIPGGGGASSAKIRRRDHCRMKSLLAERP